MDFRGDRGLRVNLIRGAYALQSVIEGVQGPGGWTIDKVVS